MDETSDRKRFWQDRDEGEGEGSPQPATTECGQKKGCQQGMSWWTCMMMGADYQFKTAKSADKPAANA